MRNRISKFVTFFRIEYRVRAMAAKPKEDALSRNGKPRQKVAFISGITGQASMTYLAGAGRAA